MEQQQQAATLETLRDIRSIMERSDRFLSLSGWSGIWAGGVALVSAWIAKMQIGRFVIELNDGRPDPDTLSDPFYIKMLVLALATLLVAAAGAFFFTMRKVKKEGARIWGNASRKLMFAIAIPLMAGGIFCLAFLVNGTEYYIAPACLAFYGLALVNGGKYTLGEIRYLGYSELALGCICLFFPRWALGFWALGFGVLHILYGIIMWNKYDKAAGA